MEPLLVMREKSVFKSVTRMSSIYLLPRVGRGNIKFKDKGEAQRDSSVDKELDTQT